MKIPYWVIGGCIASAILAPIYAAQRKKQEAEEKRILEETRQMTQSWVDGMAKEIREKHVFNATHPISGEQIEILREEEPSD